MLHGLQFPTQAEHLSELAEQPGNRCVLSALQRASVAIRALLFVFSMNASRIGRESKLTGTPKDNPPLSYRSARPPSL